MKSYVFLWAGRIHSGMAIVKRIGLVETDKNDRPIDDVKIVKGSVRNTWISWMENLYYNQLI